MGKTKLKNLRVFILSSSLWLFFDLISKYAAVRWLDKPIELIHGLLSLTLQKNQGIAFGIQLGQAIQIITSLIIVSVLTYWGIKHLFTEKRNAFLNQFLLGIIVGGALGNLANRFYPGHVIDFISLRPIPVFNLADIGITLGLLTLFVLSLSSSKK